MISPCSPSVQVTRHTSAPSAAYLAMVAPVPRDSSSGWACTSSSRLISPTIRQDPAGAGADDDGGAEVVAGGCDVVDVGGVDGGGGGVGVGGGAGGGTGAGCDAPPVFGVELTAGAGVGGGDPEFRFTRSRVTSAIRPASATALIAAKIAVRRPPVTGGAVGAAAGAVRAI